MRLEAYEREENYLPDVVLQDLQTFPVRDFQKCIRLAIRYDAIDFWSVVIRGASKNKIAGISLDQRPHLAAWIKSNWFWFTDGWSKREQYELQLRLAELTGPQEN